MAGAVARGTFDDKIKFRCNNCLIHYPIFPEDEQPTPTTTGGSSNRSTPKMFIFNCYHVCCQQCRVQFDGKCPVCRHDATCLEINRKMPRYVQAYFDPIRKSIDQLLSVVHFQKYQDDLVTKRLIGQYEMYKKRREEEEAKYHRLREELKEDKLKLDKLRVIKQIIIDEKHRREEQKKAKHEERARKERENSQKQRTKNRSNTFPMRSPSPSPLPVLRGPSIERIRVRRQSISPSPQPRNWSPESVPRQHESRADQFALQGAHRRGSNDRSPRASPEPVPRQHLSRADEFVLQGTHRRGSGDRPPRALPVSPLVRYDYRLPPNQPSSSIERRRSSGRKRY